MHSIRTNSKLSGKYLSIVTPCLNEQENIAELIQEISLKMKNYPDLDYEHLIIDNDSTDHTREILRDAAKNNPKLKIIFNTRNFGHIRSPAHGIMQASGDAVILMASDFQDPLTLIDEFIAGWAEGYLGVIAIKNESDESPLFFFVRSTFYNLMNYLSEIHLVKNYTGTGLYSRKVIEALKLVNEPYPYFRGLIPDLGFKYKKIYFKQPTRKRGFSKNNFFTLYDMAMTGITGYSRLPMRLITLFGFLCSLISLLVGIIYFGIKLLYWQELKIGIAPLIIGLGLFGSIQLFILGFIGEYLGVILTQTQKRPLVIEEERINF